MNVNDGMHYDPIQG